MRKTLLVVTALLLIFCFEGIQAQAIDFPLWHGLDNYWGMNPYFDFNSSGKSARSIGMGGTYYALNNEGYGAFLNAAGMVYTQKALMSLSTLTGRDNFSGAPFRIITADFYDTSTSWNINQSVNDFDKDHILIDQAGAVTPFYYFDREWWAGAGYRKVFDFYGEYTLPYFLEGKEAYYTQHGSVDAVNGAIATRVLPNFSLGLSMNIYVRGYEQNTWYPVPEYNEYNDTVYTNRHLKDKSTFSGSNFDISGMFDFDMIKIGFNISTAFTLTQKTLFNNEVLDEYGVAISSQSLVDRITAKNKMPMTYGGGISFMPNEQATIAFDFTYKPYSKVRIDIDPQQNAYNDVIDYDPLWEDLSQFRFGAEYVFDFESFDIPVRVGMQNLPGITKSFSATITEDTTDTGADDEPVVTIDEGDQYNTNLFSFGTGIKFQKIWFDLAYQFGKSDYAQSYTREGTAIINDHTWDTSIEQSYSRIYISASMLF